MALTIQKCRLVFLVESTITLMMQQIVFVRVSNKVISENLGVKGMNIHIATKSFCVQSSTTRLTFHLNVGR